MNSKFSSLFMATIAACGIAISATPRLSAGAYEIQNFNSTERVGITHSNSKMNSGYSNLSSTSYFGRGKSSFSSSTKLGIGQTANFQVNKDKIVIKVISADLTPLTYDGSGNVKVRIVTNGKVVNETYSISAWRLGGERPVFGETTLKNKYSLKLINFSGDFDNPYFSFQLSNLKK